MDSKKYKTAIIKCMKKAGTYQDIYNAVILTLADILQERDRIFDQYVAEGSQPMIEYTSDRGSTNRVKNPLLQQWDEMNKTALTYWRDLGLTPSGLKKLNDEAVSTTNKMSALDKVLSNLESNIS